MVSIIKFAVVVYIIRRRKVGEEKLEKTEAKGEVSLNDMVLFCFSLFIVCV